MDQGWRILLMIMLGLAAIVAVLIYLTVEPDPDAGAPGSRGSLDRAAAVQPA